MLICGKCGKKWIVGPTDLLAQCPNCGWLGFLEADTKNSAGNTTIIRW